MTLTDNKAIAVLGAGSWGTALAVLLARNGQQVLLWGNEADHMQRLSEERRNQEFLPGITFPDSLQALADLQQALSLADDVLLVVPSHAFRSVVERISDVPSAQRRLVWATKGLDAGTGKLLHEVACEVLGDELPYAVLSGPTFALEVAEGLPTAVTLASPHNNYLQDLVKRFYSKNFRVYTSDDVIGVEVGGAVKNVLAIATGMADGLGFGANTRAALVTRGLAEMMRLGVALGGQSETFMGLAGLGDLVLTCTDSQSRNRRLGLALAKGETAQQFQQSVGQIVEGVMTAQEVMAVAEKMAIEMPITSQVYRVLHQGLPVREAAQALLQRAQKAENI